MSNELLRELKEFKLPEFSMYNEQELTDLQTIALQAADVPLNTSLRVPVSDVIAIDDELLRLHLRSMRVVALTIPLQPGGMLRRLSEVVCDGIIKRLCGYTEPTSYAPFTVMELRRQAWQSLSIQAESPPNIDRLYIETKDIVIQWVNHIILELASNRIISSIINSCYKLDICISYMMHYNDSIRMYGRPTGQPLFDITDFIRERTELYSIVDPIERCRTIMYEHLRSEDLVRYNPRLILPDVSLLKSNREQRELQRQQQRQQHDGSWGPRSGREQQRQQQRQRQQQQSSVISSDQWRQQGQQWGQENYQTQEESHDLGAVATSCLLYNAEEDLTDGKRKILRLFNQTERKCTEEAKRVSNLQTNQYIGKSVKLPTLPTGDSMTVDEFNVIMNMIKSNPGKITVLDQQGIDQGGVTRMVLNELAIFLKRHLLEKDDKYHLIPKSDSSLILDSDTIKNIANFAMMVISKQEQVDLPLSIGLLHIIQQRKLRKIISLPTLLWLFRLNVKDEDYTALMSIMTEISKEDITDYLNSYVDTYHEGLVALKEQTTYEDRLKWLSKILYVKLFNPMGTEDDLKNIIQFASFVALRTSKWTGTDTFYDTFTSFSPSISAENMSQLVILAYNSDPLNDANIGYLKRFIAEGNPEIWTKLLVFIHGTPDVRKTIELNLVGGKGLPQSHTCSGTLDVRKYDNYKEFSRDLTYAIENTSGLANA